MALLQEFKRKSDEWGCDLLSEDFATHMDDNDELKQFRQEYNIPKCGTIEGGDPSYSDPHSDCIYLASNSLGLMSHKTKEYVNREMNRWADLGVQGHFVGHMGWASCDEDIQEQAASIVGAKRDEVVMMNALSVNQHFLLISFYQPTPTRHRILLETHAFPSDHYVVQSQIKLKGYNPDSSMLMISPREGEELLRTEDILEIIEKEGESIALVMLPGVQYYTGQVFDMKTITEAAHAKGCLVGFDLAHAVGNVVLKMHEWDVDFACWCSYKYLSAGAGGIGGIFIHERHQHNDFPKLHGWWSHEPNTRFDMDNEFTPSPSPACYRISNPSMFHCASLEGSLEVMLRAGLDNMRAKSVLLTGYLEVLLLERFPASTEALSTGRPYVKIITPSDPEKRGCQLSLRFSVDLGEMLSELTKRGVLCDVRKPHVMRIAPSPLYNTFLDVFNFVRHVAEIFGKQ